MNKQSIVALIAGLVFALGLTLGGMTDPRKVINFLDVAGHWDPSLAFVMGAAILAYAPLYRLVTRRRRMPLCDATFHLPTRRDIDMPLVVGSVAFGIGWGLGGFCPGPALTASASLGSSALVFTASLLVGMLAFSVWQGRRNHSRRTNQESTQ